MVADKSILFWEDGPCCTIPQQPPKKSSAILVVMTQTKTNTTQSNINTKRIINWGEYNRSLVSRGNISVYISEALAQRVSARPHGNGKIGHPFIYQDALIELILTLRELVHLPLRQTTGFVAGLLIGMGISWDLPDYSTLSRRMGKLRVSYCRKCNRGDIVLLLDSSGFKVFGEGEWKVRKHGTDKRRTWRESHIAVDFATRDILGFINTESDAHDATQFRPLIRVARQNISNKNKLSTVIGDGAYDANHFYHEARAGGFEFIAPPRKGATERINMRRYCIYDKPGWEDRNAVVRHCEEYGVDGWKADVDYHRRSLVENAFYRIKTIFGTNLKSHKEDTQYAEQSIRIKLINRFNSMGLPKYDTTP